jgi:thiol-disulfide isomerase/thioredoxin
MRRIQIAGLAGLVLASSMLISQRAGAEDPATQPTTKPAVSAEALGTELDSEMQSIQQLIGSPDTLSDATKRAAIAPKVIPHLKTMVTDLTTMADLNPQAKDRALEGRSEFIMLLSVFGDADATKTLATQAASPDATTALRGKSSQLMVTWTLSATDTPAQTAVVEKIEKLAKENPTSGALTGQILGMSQMGCSSKDLAKRLQFLITDVMKNDVATGAKEQLAGEQKLAALEDKPLVIAGKQADGKDFTTADWKGKVILVDFWATWCGPCREELPRVTKMYTDFHAKGLEVLGVSNDYSADDLTKFLGENKAMAWPQLFDADAAKSQSWNPITTGYGISGIPTMFLIDKKGVCRTVEAREKMEDLILKLLAE